MLSHLHVIVHLQEDWAGAGEVPVALLEVLDGPVVQVVTVTIFMISGEGPSLPCEGPGGVAVELVLLSLGGLLPEVRQLAQQSGQLQLASPLLQDELVVVILLPTVRLTLDWSLS